MYRREHYNEITVSQWRIDLRGRWASVATQTWATPPPVHHVSWKRTDYTNTPYTIHTERREEQTHNTERGKRRGYISWRMKIQIQNIWIESATGRFDGPAQRSQVKREDRQEKAERETERERPRHTARLMGLKQMEAQRRVTGFRKFTVFLLAEQTWINFHSESSILTVLTTSPKRARQIQQFTN